MAQGDFIVTETHEKVKRILTLVEQAQALSAEVWFISPWPGFQAGLFAGNTPWTTP